MMAENNMSAPEVKADRIRRRLNKKDSLASSVPVEKIINRIAEYMLAQSNIRDKYLEQDLSDLNLDADQKKICNQIIHAYKDSLKNYLEKGQGAYLWASGNEDNQWGTGTGKTSLAVILIKEVRKDLARYVYNNLPTRKQEALEERNFSTRVWEHDIFKSRHVPYFIKGSDYFPSLQSADNYEEKRLKARAREAKILIWDDFGTEKIEWFHDEMYSLIDYRVENNRPIIFTSNWYFDVFANQDYKKNSERMKENGGRLASRIAGMVKNMVFRMEGADWRMKELKNINW